MKIIQDLNLTTTSISETVGSTTNLYPGNGDSTITLPLIMGTVILLLIAHVLDREFNQNQDQSSKTSIFIKKHIDNEHI